MADFYRRLIKLLRENGCQFVRHGKGDHEIWWSPKTNMTFSIDRGTKSRQSVNTILKLAGLEKEF